MPHFAHPLSECWIFVPVRAILTQACPFISGIATGDLNALPSWFYSWPSGTSALGLSCFMLILLLGCLVLVSPLTFLSELLSVGKSAVSAFSKFFHGET